MTESPDGERVTVVVPTYDERDNLPDLVDQLIALPVPGLRILVVDDNSPDGTGELAEKLAAGLDGRLDVLHRAAKEGLGRAYVAGMTRALADGADVVIQMDADLSHPPSVIPDMIATLRRSGAGVVVGSRYVPGGHTAADWPWHRKALSLWANFYVNAILRLHVKDATAGYKAWRAGTLRAICVQTVRSNGYSFQVEMNYRTIRAGLAIAEVPITFSERAGGTSKMTLKVQLESARTPWRLLFGRAPRA